MCEGRNDEWCVRVGMMDVWDGVGKMDGVRGGRIVVVVGRNVVMFETLSTLRPELKLGHIHYIINLQFEFDWSICDSI